MTKLLPLFFLLGACQDTSGPDYPIIPGYGNSDPSPDAGEPVQQSCRNHNPVIYMGSETLTIILTCAAGQHIPNDPPSAVTLASDAGGIKQVLNFDLTCGNNTITFPATKLWVALEVTGKTYDFTCY